ncbi:hypothetical protein PMAYCL1PPCAC_19733, partial [Pristionchus mayeri]
LQQSVQRATGKSFEIFMGKGDMITASHQMSEDTHCRMRIGDYYTTVYETPVQYNINDVEAEKIMSNIDFGEPLGGSGYEGQLPFPRLTPYELIERGGFISFFQYYAPYNPPYYPAPPVPDMQCFSGDLIVETREGPKRMRELKMSDEVMSIEKKKISFTPIVMFLHRDEEILAEFNVISTANGDSVKLTNEHLIYVSDCSVSSLRLVRAKEVTADHCMMTVQSQYKHSDRRAMRLDRVTNVSKTYERGIYAPLTSSGDIVVNSILSSCHSNLAARSLQQSLFSLYRSLSFLIPEDGALPLGLAYLMSAVDLFIPLK